MAIMHKIHKKYFFLVVALILTNFIEAKNDCGNNPSVFFENIYDGFISNSEEFEVRFGSSDINVIPISQPVNSKSTCIAGHHHLLINTELPDMSRPIPSSNNYIHFGKGQTKAIVKLKPGIHSLQLLLGNFSHIPHNPPIMSEKIIIEVISNQ